MFDPDDYELHEAQKHACKMARERDEAEIERLRMAENRAELLAEDIECLHMNLDDAGVPRDDGSGNTYSLWGRVLRFKDMTPNA